MWFILLEPTPQGYWGFKEDIVESLTKALYGGNQCDTKLEGIPYSEKLIDKKVREGFKKTSPTTGRTISDDPSESYFHSRGILGNRY